MSLSIRHPADSIDIQKIIKLLLTCFPRVPEHYFLERYFKPTSYKYNSSFMGMLGEELVSFIHTLPLSIYWSGKMVDVIGIGGVCTDPSKRSHGFSTELMNGVLEIHGDTPLSLLTRQPDFYRKFMFHTIKRTTISMSLKNSFLSDNLTIEKGNWEHDIPELQTIYSTFASSHYGPIQRNNEYWNAQQRYIHETPECFLVAKLGGVISGYMRGRMTEKSIRIIDFGALDNAMKQCLQGFNSYFFNQGYSLKMEIPYAIGNILDSVELSDRAEINALFMVRDGKSFSWNLPHHSEILIFDSDGF